jgi:hypothetical protein
LPKIRREIQQPLKPDRDLLYRFTQWVLVAKSYCFSRSGICEDFNNATLFVKNRQQGLFSEDIGENLGRGVMGFD